MYNDINRQIQSLKKSIYTAVWFMDLKQIGMHVKKNHKKLITELL